MANKRLGYALRDAAALPRLWLEVALVLSPANQLNNKLNLGGSRMFPAIGKRALLEVCLKTIAQV